MEVVLLIVRLILAGVFGVAAIGKLLDRAGSEKAARDFGVPPAMSGTVAYLLPLVEVLIAVALLFVQSSWLGAIGSGLLLTGFTAAMAVQMAKGNAPDCHCFGQIHSEPVGTASVIRNIVLLALSALLIASGRSRQGIDFLDSRQDVIVFGLGIVVIGLLAIAISQLRAISSQQRELMRRIELMELVANEGGQVEREDVAPPHEGLPIGALFPAFELPDLKGRTVSLETVKSDRSPVLFFFISPTCGPCKALVPEFEQWQRELAGRIKLVFVSTGTAEDNEAKFGAGHGLTVLLQKQRELAEIVHAQWTPTALLMDENGRIASHPTAGDTAIRAMVEAIKGRDPANDPSYFTNGHGHAHYNRLGSTVPEFSVTDIKGRQITSEMLRGRQTLVTFWSLTCPHCHQMAEDLRTWEKARGKDDPELLLFSDGEASANEELGLDAPVIVEEGYRTAAQMGMSGTPSAVLVDESGRIISETAIGAPNIWALVGRRN